jgi:hypothetical protein
VTLPRGAVRFLDIQQASSAAAAKSGFEITLRASSYLGLQSVSGIGEEAWLSTKEASNANGEEEYTSAGFVRSRNVTAYLFIAGDADADAAEARLLLGQVASAI